jgi:hypothetical protein
MTGAVFGMIRKPDGNLVDIEIMSGDELEKDIELVTGTLNCSSAMYPGLMGEIAVKTERYLKDLWNEYSTR